MKCGWRSAVALGAMLYAPVALAQSQESTAAAQAPVVAGSGSTDTHPVKDAQEATQNLFRAVNTPYATGTKLGYGSGDVKVGVPLSPGSSYNLPLVQWGFRPDDAEIKLGNFYLDVGSLTGAVLYSDNANQSETSRKSGAIAMVQLKFAVLWQIVENLRLSAASAVTWLPFNNRIAITSPLAGLDANLAIGPQALFQLVYDVPLGGWDLQLYDQFSASKGSYGLRDNVDLFSRDPYSIEDRIGRYAFREDVERQIANSNGLLEERFSRVTEYRNTVGMNIARVIPTETELRLYAMHSDSWYTGNSTGLPSSRDTAGVRLESVRENMRFKPFFEYNISKSNIQRNWDHAVSGGIKGPVTDHIDFLGDVGYTYIGDSKNETMTWRIFVKHSPRPSTAHSIEYSRYVTYPDRDVGTTLSYRLEQGMGPYLTGGLAIERSTFEDLDNNNSASTEYRGQVKLDLQISPRSNIRSTAMYSDIDYVDPVRADYKIFTGRIEFINKTTETVTTSLMYQYEKRDSSLPGDSYYENLVLLQVTKTF